LSAMSSNNLFSSFFTSRPTILTSCNFSDIKFDLFREGRPIQSQVVRVWLRFNLNASTSLVDWLLEQNDPARLCKVQTREQANCLRRVLLSLR
jgi:hypothetical protein